VDACPRGSSSELGGFPEENFGATTGFPAGDVVLHITRKSKKVSPGLPASRRRYAFQDMGAVLASTAQES